MGDVRILHASDRAVIEELCAQNPVANVFAAARIAEMNTHPAQVWGYEEAGVVRDLCYVSGNVVPIATHRDSLQAFAKALVRRGKRCASLLGPADSVRTLWEYLSPPWVAREIRADQPVLALSTPPSVAGDPYVRRAVAADMPALWPAAVAMHTEEVGLSPLMGDGGASFRARLEALVATGMAFVRFSGTELIFKAEIGSVAHGVCQVQGVWVPPHWRGRGVGTTSMAAVTQEAQRTIAPTVSLYVNDFNTSARAMYRRCGYVRVGTYATVSL